MDCIARFVFHLTILGMALFYNNISLAQELNCMVEVNSQSIDGTNQLIFEKLKEEIESYFNDTKWTNANYSQIERIDCRFFLTVKEYSDDRIKGDVQVQLSRPVYNSTYTSTLINFKDNKVEFNFREGDRLVHNESAWENNLCGILDFYAWLFLAIDSDSFSLKGGQEYFDKAASVVQMAQSSGEPGWKAFEDNKNRSALLSSFIDGSTSAIRSLLYSYHRKGLDEMSISPEKGRASITESLSELREIYSNSPMSAVLSLFRDSKLDELVNIYSEAPEDECRKVYDILKPLYPADNDRLEKIRGSL